MVLNSTWHVMALHETEIKGVFKVWIYLETKQIVSIRLQIDRLLYLHSYEPQVTGKQDKSE